jgi:hypothetical protein
MQIPLQIKIWLFMGTLKLSWNFFPEISSPFLEHHTAFCSLSVRNIFYFWEFFILPVSSQSALLVCGFHIYGSSQLGLEIIEKKIVSAPNMYRNFLVITP